VADAPDHDPARQRRVPVDLWASAALPEVSACLAPRCGSAALAKDLTAETFMSAVDAVRRRTVGDLTVAPLIPIAQVADHWRRGAGFADPARGR
jgi:hypothetical protein